MSSYQIEPIEQVSTLTYNYITCRVGEVELGVSAKVITTFYDIHKNGYKTEVALLQGDDYKAWGSDDTYIVNWVANKYGLVLIPSN